ncbi:hypothetical protein HOY34_06725 [Xinfangfangia sp. D13-10-4-6]|nr:hypothetical protein [Pseudogemmobacter hezensis]NPD14901.1 hypothetical protein [Pseudogemmobacter hezensis]
MGGFAPEERLTVPGVIHAVCALTLWLVGLAGVAFDPEGRGQVPEPGRGK